MCTDRERILSRDEEGLVKKPEAYPLWYVEDFFTKPDEVAGQKTPRDVYILMASLVDAAALFLCDMPLKN